MNLQTYLAQVFFMFVRTFHPRALMLCVEHHWTYDIKKDRKAAVTKPM